jgi:probable addiction module antidote protein
MNKIFIGGSRHITRLPLEVQERLENVIALGHEVLIGDANGADKAAQKYFFEAAYNKVTVYCSGDNPRNNVGSWRTQNVYPPKNVKGFQFYAAKDREMAAHADAGLMIWDGKSPGTVLNILRLLLAGKSSLLVHAPEKRTTKFKSLNDWSEFLQSASTEFLDDLRERAIPSEWNATSSLLLASENAANQIIQPSAPEKSEAELEADINIALASSEASIVLNALGIIAKAHGMSTVAKEAGLARESLYRSLNSGGNPEFSTVLKVMASVGLRLTVSKISSQG